VKSTLAMIVPRTPEPSCIYEIGTVSGYLGEGRFHLASGGVAYEARQAHSCLVRPQAGDTVLFCGADTHSLFVLHILERPGSAEVRVCVDGDLILQSERGNVSLASDADIKLDGRRGVRIDTAHMAVTAEHSEYVSAKASFVCEDLQGRVGLTQIIGKRIETIVDRIVQISRQTFRSVEQIDHLRTSRADYEASDHVRIHGGHSVVTADHLVKVDAQQIHLG
jgi:hypothetical protein